MADITFVTANKNYSSWSLRGWLALKQTGVAFKEIVIPLKQPDTKAAIQRHSPSGKLPALDHKGVHVWESLAICDFLAETYPKAGLWPEDAAARALARSVASEMHAGFAPLRANMPMDMRGARLGNGMNPEVAADIERILAIWRDCRQHYGKGGPFLFGRLTAADAMFAPVVSRFTTYGVPLDAGAQAYRDAVWALPAMLEWREAAAREPWVIDY